MAQCALLSGGLAVLFGSLIGVPLAPLTVRHRFPGRGLLTVLGVMPLVVPPFVGPWRSSRSWDEAVP